MPTPVMPIGIISCRLASFGLSPLGSAALGIGAFSGFGAAAGAAFSSTGMVARSDSGGAVHLLRRGEGRVEDFGVRAAATDIPARRVLHIGDGGCLVLRKQRRTAHHHAGGAE